MIRHFFLFAAAPGRQDEAEAALGTWLAAAADRPQMRGGAVLRARAGEFGDFQPPIAVTYDVESREAGLALKEAMQTIPNPMAADIPGTEPADQGGILFADDHGHGHQHATGGHRHEHAPADGHAPGDGGDHQHAETGHPHLRVSGDATAKIHFDRGGGLLGRLLHVHFEVIAGAQAAPGKTGTGR